MTVTLTVRLLTAAALACVVVLAAGCGDRTAEAVQYHCPMHPTYISDRPGDCPICGMRLVPIETRTAPTRVAAYSCPMHPEVTSDVPGRCPLCGMKLVPAAEVEDPASQAKSAPTLATRPAAEHMEMSATTPAPGAVAGRQVLFYRNPMDPSITSPVPTKDSMGMDYVPVYADEVAAPAAVTAGHAIVQFAPAGLKLAGVQTAPVVRASLARSVRTVGNVLADETRVRHVHTKISGWVERLHVDFTGQHIRAGEPILSLYSPELLASQEEFLRARQAAAQFGASQLPEVRRGGEDLASAARRRLELFDVPEAFIAELERTGTPRRTVTLLAPVSGYVTAKNVVEGHEVQPGEELFTITDLARIWVEADFYEYEAAWLSLGARGTITLAYDPAVSLAGRIAFIYPTLDPATRTLRVRFEFANPGLKLKPGMFADVEVQMDPGEGLVIPDSAIIDTGERRLVFVSRSDGSFEPREVRIGVRSGGRARVLDGLAENEEVAVRANFLLDSESRLRAAIAGTVATPARQH